MMRNPIIRFFSVTLSMLLLATLAVVSGPSNAAFADLGDTGGLTIKKLVNNLPAITGVQPGETFTYSVEVGCDDNDCIDAKLVDELPAAFAGFQLGAVTVSPANPANYNLQLTGGCAENAPTVPGCQIEVNFLQSLGSLAGVPQVGIRAGTTFRISYSLTAPLTLTPTWASNGVAVPNTADITATNAATKQSIARVTVDVPVVVDAAVTKTWTPNSQQYGPGSASTIRTSIGNASNVVANTLTLQDPAVISDPSATLPASNPFTRVDFTGLCGVTLPQGADLVRVDAFYEAPAGNWHWETGTAAAAAALPAAVTDLSKVGGLRVTYTSSTGDTIVAGGTVGELCFTVAQRATDRTTGAALVTGGSIANLAIGRVQVTGQTPVTRNANASLTVTGLNVDVAAGKQITPKKIPASGEFSVAVSGKNNSNGTLNSLTITEPGSGAFLSDKLIFNGFTQHTWPTGASAATLTWSVNSGAPPTPVALTSGSPLPGMPALAPGQYITGFAVTYTGAIIAGTTAGWTFGVDTVATMVTPPAVSDRYTNTVGVSGTNAAGTDTDSASDYVDVYYPDINIALDKKLDPKLTTPGGLAVMELEAVTSAESQYVRPTTIVVEDYWDGTPATSFWDAYRPSEILFTDVPAGSVLRVQFALGTPPALTWHELTPAGGVTSIINSLAVPANAVGLRFIYTDSAGFGQGTSVKPNISFVASATLRDGTTTTDVPGLPATRYDNKAHAKASGMADALPVTSPDVTDTDYINMIIFGGTGPGTLISSKRWVSSNWAADVDNLRSQSGATARTLLGWGVTTPGYSSALISDGVPGSETTPATTVFQAFNLTRVAPISFIVDPLMRWDTVSSVELYYSGAWHTVTPPAGGWMNTTGFRGHTLNATESAGTTGVRITVVENTAVRTASTDPARPAPGSGVASSATERPIRLVWELRNTLRVPISPTLKWVTQSVAYNLPGNGVLRNTFQLGATSSTGTTTLNASDDISFIDTTPNVSTVKTASKAFVTVPYFGDVSLGDYPTVDFTIDAWNTASARASYLRSADPIPCSVPTACVTAASNNSPDIFTGNAFSAATNPFERFNLTGITIVTPSATNIDRTASQVALWHRDASGVLTVTQMSINAATALTAVQLSDVIGVSVVYQSTDPATTGGLIPQQNSSAAHPSMTLHTQLRSHLRSDPLTLVTSGVTVTNNTLAQSFDPVLTPTGIASTPNASTSAPVELRTASLDVTASKVITPKTILEANPSTPITVTLGATDGTSTLGAETATIRDVDANFWGAFRFTGLGAVTLPAPGTQVRVEVQLSGSATWIVGAAGATPTLPASVTDLTQITGIQFVYDRADGLPFSSTVPSADWSASAVFTAVLRDGATFPGSVVNQIQTFATHQDYPVRNAAASDTVTLSNGTAQMDVRKEAITGNTTHITEPGTEIPWTLEFTNTGTGFLNVTTVVDNYDSYLQWDGQAPTYATSTGGTLPTTGITVTEPATGQLLFAWPAGSKMLPGETFIITIKFGLLPGLTPSQQAKNEFTANTVQTLTACTNTSGNLQGILTGLTATQCGTSNYVQPLSGALLFAQKSVKGEVDGTLVDGAVNIDDPTLPCTADSAGFFRAQCVARTAVGATDTWRLVTTNSGTVGYTSVTLVDVLPNIGDRMLATGAARGSAFRPVLKDIAAPSYVGTLPAGTTTTWEVSTDVNACVGSNPGTSDWGSDPTCAATTWVLGTSFVGNSEDITAVRYTADFSGAPGGVLPPAGTVEVRFDTLNVPLSTPNAISVSVPVTNQVAWNQFGVAVDAVGGDVIRRAPVKVGVLAGPATLQVAKTVNGDAASFAPATFGVALSCTVPDGSGGTEPVDMGSFASISVPSNGFTNVSGIPLGASCKVDSETLNGGATSTNLGSTVNLTSAVNPAVITVTNTFDGGPLDIIKNRVGVAALTHGAGPFTIQVVCTWAPDGVATAIPLANGGKIILNSGNSYRAQLPIMPVGTSCTVMETDAGDATDTTMNPANGVIAIVQPGPLVPAATVTITNVFGSSLLAFTGIDGIVLAALLSLAILLLIAGAAVLVGARIRRRNS